MTVSETMQYQRFEIRNLGVLALSVGFTLWIAKIGEHPLNVILQPHYFDTARDMMRPGDMIMISSVHGGTIIRVDAVISGEVVIGKMFG